MPSAVPPRDAALAFDVNETLLDLAALDPVFARLFGDAGARREWFAGVIRSALVATATRRYRPFGEHAMAALGVLATRRAVALSDEDRDAVREGLATLPPHPDVAPALERLAAGGARVAALTNSTVEVAEAQLASAGLRPLVAVVASADEVGRLKPAPEPYALAAGRLGVPLEALWLVAAHDWDVAGAQAAGARTVFVARPGQVLDPAFPSPDLVVADLGELADLVLDRSAE